MKIEYVWVSIFVTFAGLRAMHKQARKSPPFHPPTLPPFQPSISSYLA